MLYKTIFGSIEFAHVRGGSKDKPANSPPPPKKKRKIKNIKQEKIN
jgi:hypothetical protein